MLSQFPSQIVVLDAASQGIHPFVSLPLESPVGTI